MSWLAAENPIAPEFTTIQISTSTSILPVPIIWGTAKVAVNIVWSSPIRLKKLHSGKGFLGGSNTQYIYGADLVLAICEGPIVGVGAIWTNNAQYTLATATNYGGSWTLFNGTIPQTAWSFLTTNYPTQALSYEGTAYFGLINAYLGFNATLGNVQVEVKGVLAGTGVNGIDADPAQVVDDFLTNGVYGVGFDSGSIDYTTLYSGFADDNVASLQSYCKAQGIGFSPALVTAEQASTILTRWLQLLNCAAVWSSGKLKFIPYGDLAINAGDITTTVQVTVPSGVPPPTPPAPFPTVFVASPAQFVSDGGVTYAFNGMAFTHTGTAPTGVGTYGISPAGTYVFFAAGSGSDIGEVVNITFTYSNPVNYVPNLAAVYSLTDLDYVPQGKNKDPVTCARVDPYSLPTIQRIEVLSRDNQYSGVPIEARDQSQIEIYGPRVGTTIQAHEICDEVIIAPIVVQTILQRGLYIRATYTFVLSPEYCLLDPMDIVELTDANLGLSDYPVRIRSVEEDDHYNLKIIAEELTAGISTPAYYASSGNTQSSPTNSLAGVNAINAPLIYEPGPLASGGKAVIWFGASSVADPISGELFGGANVWVSIDNVTYQEVGTLTAPMVQGVLTATFASGSGWDTTSTCSVDLTESAGALIGTSMAYAEQGGTLSLVDSELFAYETATLTSAFNYDLTNLERGLYGTTGASHASAAVYYRIELGATVMAFPVPPNYIGVLLYVKFQGFNIFGSGVQDLSTCTAYTYTPTGAGLSPGAGTTVGPLSGGTVTTTLTIPPGGVYLIAVGSTVLTTITGCTSFNVGTPSSASLYGNNLPLIAGDTFAGTISPVYYPTSTTLTIQLQAIGGGFSFTAGEVQLTATWASSIAPSA